MLGKCSLFVKIRAKQFDFPCVGIPASIDNEYMVLITQLAFRQHNHIESVDKMEIQLPS